MAISKKTGRQYQSRKERGYGPAKRRFKAQRYPKGFDRWGQPTICGVVDEGSGKACPDPVVEPHRRCQYHQDLSERAWRRSRDPGNPPSSSESAAGGDSE